MSCQRQRYQCFLSKDTTETLEVALEFCDLLKTGETIDAVDWHLPVSGDLSIVSQVFPPTDGVTVSAVLSGGVAGQAYTVAATVRTSDGQQQRLAASIAVRDCP